MDVYRAVAWLGWVPNLIVGELLIWNYSRQAKKRIQIARDLNASKASDT
jgi:hypothetical protein